MPLKTIKSYPLAVNMPLDKEVCERRCFLIEEKLRVVPSFTGTCARIFADHSSTKTCGIHIVC